MSSTRIGDNIIQVTRWRFVNAFLVREDDGYTLVDTTVGGGADQLIATARNSGADIRRIALTHGHGDHVGSLDALKQQLGDSVQVLMPQLDTRDRTVIAGDVFTSIGWLAVSNHYYLRFPLAAMATWDKSKDLESAQRLRALDPALLVVGHGRPVRAPGPAMDTAIKNAGGS